MNPPQVYFYVCGILTVPGASDNWTGKAVTWTHLHKHIPAEKIEYFGTPLNRNLKQDERARRFLKNLRYYNSAGFEISIAGHSNGADVILDALKLFQRPIKALHLIAPACSEDCEKSGLNDVLCDNITIHWSSSDTALKLVKLAGSLFGFGILGLVGPQNIRIPMSNIQYPNYDHSDWFSHQNFQQTMNLLTSHV